MDQTPHVALLPSPGMGHLIPLVEFAKQLLHHHHISSTLIIPTTGPPPQTQISVLELLPENLNHIFLPHVHLPENLPTVVLQLWATMSLSIPSLRNTLKLLSSTNRLVALVVDPFRLDAFDVAEEIGVAPYIYSISTAMSFLFWFHMPKLDKMFTCEYRDLPEPVKLPGCVPVQERDLFEAVQDRSHVEYRKLLENVSRVNSFEGIIIKRFLDLEEGAIKALQVEEPCKPPVYPIGPLTQTGSSDGAPQIEVLRHSSTGRFLTHSGLNSTLDSVFHGVPLIAWPIYADQKMIAVMLNEGLKVALRIKANEIGIVEREEIARDVKELIEGEEGKKVREKIKSLQDAAGNALNKNESSAKSLSELAFRWKI
ncbi:hypothetical protein RHMOL_Rhmol07G0040200 [Rhododendron molle]|uniref:Uncharacterized protein n=1 Tax=Rhododendron molle TaxID=49168 RepID=A0ACC0MX22_RHOML|nr:hypothetical protein RHMOL_Rhmol07G0040200 [Rhododendron molle]